MNALRRQTGEAVVTIFIIAAIALLALGIWAAVEDSRKWEAFKVARNCKFVAHVRGSTHVGMSTSGNMVVMGESDKTGWLCDDGVTYYR